MFELNRLLLFISVVSPIVLLARTWKSREGNRAWRLAALAVLIVTIAAWLLARSSAGFVAGGAWLALLLLPALGLRRIAELSARQKFGKARRLASLVRWFHPARGLRQQTRVLRALDLAQ